MAYDSIDIQHIIRQAEEHTRIHDEDAQKWREVEADTFDYGALIPKELYNGDSGTGEPLVIRRAGLQNDTDIIQSVVGWPARISVDLPKAGIEASRKEDELEAYFAYSSHMCDPRGEKKSSVHAYQTLWPYTGIWQHAVPYDPPKKRRDESTKDYEYRKQAYDKKYWRYAWEVPIPDHLSFLARGGDATLACLWEDIPVIDFMQDYAELDDEDDLTPLTLFTTQFPWLRASDGTAPERNNETKWFSSAKIRRWMVCDGTNIYHQVEMGGTQPTRDTRTRKYSRTVGDMHEAMTCVPNTFGRCSFVLIHSRYRPGNTYAHRSLISGIAPAYYNVTMMQSLYATMQANDRWLTTLPQDVAQSLVLADAQADPGAESAIAKYQSEIVSGMANPLLGTPTNANALPQQWWELVQHLEAQLTQARAPIISLLPNEVTQRNAPAASVLAAQQQGMRPWERPTTSWCTGVQTLFEMQAHDVVYGLNGHLANVGESRTHNRDMRGEQNRDYVDFLAGDYTGKASYQPSSRIPKGKPYKLSPEQFNEFLTDGKVTVEPMADTDATRAARSQEARDKLNNIPPLATPEDVWIAEGETDVTGKAKRLNDYIYYQQKVPYLDNYISQLYLETEAARTGRDIGELAIMFGMGGPTAVNGDNMPKSKPMLNSTSVAPPPSPMPREPGVV